MLVFACPGSASLGAVSSRVITGTFELCSCARILQPREMLMLPTTANDRLRVVKYGLDQSGFAQVVWDWQFTQRKVKKCLGGTFFLAIYSSRSSAVKA